MQRIITETNCDWHSQIETPVQVPATHVRVNPEGKENDLCEACCMMFDWGMPRVETLVKFFQPDVIERLLRTGREPAGRKSERRTTQPALPGTDAKPRKTTTPPTQPKAEPETPPGPSTEARKRAVANRGRRNPDIDQVLCPLPHTGANSPKEYYVAVRDRGSHARSSHNGLLGPQVPWEMPADATFTLDVKCFQHKVCAEAGGFGFKSAAGLAMHLTKANAEGWEPAPAADTTATGKAA